MDDELNRLGNEIYSDLRKDQRLAEEKYQQTHSKNLHKKTNSNNHRVQ